MLKTKYKKWQKIMLRSKCQIVETTCKNNLQKQPAKTVAVQPKIWYHVLMVRVCGTGEP